MKNIKGLPMLADNREKIREWKERGSRRNVDEMKYGYNYCDDDEYWEERARRQAAEKAERDYDSAREWFDYYDRKIKDAEHRGDTYRADFYESFREKAKIDMLAAAINKK